MAVGTWQLRVAASKVPMLAAGSVAQGSLDHLAQSYLNKVSLRGDVH